MPAKGCLKRTRKEAIAFSRKRHKGTNYTYGEYYGATEPWKIFCHKVDDTGKEHGEFTQTFDRHNRKRRPQFCPDCTMTNMITKMSYTEKDFNKLAKEKFGNNRKKYKEYNGFTTSTTFICEYHGTFIKTPKDYLRLKYACEKCGNDETGNKLKLTFQEFLTRVKEKNIDFKYFDFSHYVYTNLYVHSVVICKRCMYEWNVAPCNLLAGSRCPNCHHKMSEGLEKIIRWLIKYKIKFVLEYRFKLCRIIKPLPFDVYLPDYNLCIEYDGQHHYRFVPFGGISKEQSIKNFIKTWTGDQVKNQFCMSNSVDLLRIPYWEVPRIESILKRKLLPE